MSIIEPFKVIAKQMILSSFILMKWISKHSKINDESEHETIFISPFWIAHRLNYTFTNKITLEKKKNTMRDE